MSGTRRELDSLDEPDAGMDTGADQEADERIELDFVEESIGDDVEEAERPKSARSLSAPRSPDAEETVVVHPVDYDGDERSQELKQPKQEPSEQPIERGPKTPPEGEPQESKEKTTEKVEARGLKRRYSSSSRSRSKGSSRSSYSEDGRSPPQSYKESESVEARERGELSVEERLRQNKKARLVRLREARSRHLGHEYIAPLSSKKFTVQPYFKNPSYYPDEVRDKDKPPAPPPLAQKIIPMPGGRLPLVQRRSSPPPFETRRRSPVPLFPQMRKRRTIVEDTFRVTSRRSPSRRSRSPPPSYRSSRHSSASKDLGPQTLYPSRRDPYPLSYSLSRGSSSSSRDRDYERRSSNHSSGSNGNSSYIFTGTKYVQRPFIPPPPPGKQWNCPQRDVPYVPSSGSRRWQCPQREPDTPPRR